MAGDALPVADAETCAVQRMAAYYARRATEYETVYAKPERQADIRALEAWLPGALAGRRVLEVACGTGWWTVHGARDAAAWLATDLNPETLAIARAKRLPACVDFETADAYAPPAAWGGGRFDAAFAGFWWSHVPLQRLGPWLQTLHALLPPGARVVFMDNREVPGSTTPIGRTDAHGNTWQQRRLADGSQHEVLKNFPTREAAFAALGPRARAPQWMTVEHYWVLHYELS